MMILRLLGKVALIPVWLLVAIVWLIVKVMVEIYSFARGFAVLGLGALIVGTIVCYQDWVQVAFLLGLCGITFAVLFVGTFAEVLLETVRMVIGKRILA